MPVTVNYFVTPGAGPENFVGEAPPINDAFALLIAAQQEISLAPPELEARLGIATKYARQIGGADGATIELRDGDEMVYHAGSGTLAPFLGLRLPLHGSLSGRGVLEGKTLYCADSDTDDRVDRAACRRVKARSMVVIPLLHNQTVIGVLKAASPQPQAFLDTDIAALQVMGSVIIAAMSGVAETEAKSAQSAAENRLRLAAQSANVGIWRWDMIENELYWSDETYALMDVPPGTKVGPHAYLTQIHPDDHAAIRDAITAALEQKASYAFEMRARQSDGTHRWIGARGRGLYDENGKPIALEGVILDISERKRLEEALRQSVKEAQEIGNAMPQIVWTAQPDGYLDWYNDRWHEFTGFPRGEGGDSSWKPILHPDDLQMCYDTWYESVQTGKMYEIEYRFFDRVTRKYRWHLGRALPLRDDNGAIRKWLGTCTDIDDFKRERAAHRETAERMNALLDNTPAIMFVRDLEGRYLLINRGFEWASGLSEAEVIGKSDAELFPKAIADGVRARDLAVIADGEPMISEETSPLNGELHTYFVVKFPLRNTEGMIYAIGAISTDITDRKRDQAEIEALNKRLRRAMAETHHRVKNNLQTISAMLDMQAMDAECPPSIEDLKRLSRQVRTLAAVHDILTEEAMTDGLADNISTSVILDKLLLMLRQAVPHRPVRARIADVRLSARQGNSLALMVNELLSNAVKYGKVNSSILFDIEAETARLEVADDGPGFPPAFDPKKAANTGLELVENMARWDLGGETRYETRPGGGGLVTVTFPLQERPYMEMRF